MLLGRRTRKKSKLEVNWTGPFEVVGTVDSLIYKIKKLGKPDVLRVHASRMAHLATEQLNVTAELKEHAHDFEFEVEKFVDFGEEDDEEFFLRTRWLGFEAMDDTWERLQKMIEDVPRVVVKYLETIREQHAKIPELIKDIKEEMKNARK